MNEKDKIQKKWAELIAKAWMDEKFKKELLANPGKVFKEHGMDLHGMKYEILENTKNKCYFILPMKPEGNISERDLKEVAAAVVCNYTALSNR